MVKSRIILPTEYQECEAFFTWAQFNPILREYLIKIANEGKRSAITGHRLKRIGLRKGIPDYFLPVSNDKYHGLWLEMKKQDGNKIVKRDEQSEWIEKLQKIGHYASFAYGWKHAAQITKDYLNNRI